MKNWRKSVFVLWGRGFEEVATTILVRELRRSGLRVKVVGLNMQGIAGSHGLALSPDITLGTALAQVHTASCVIVPCSVAELDPFFDDPRVGEFFRLAIAHRSLIIMAQAKLPGTCLKTDACFSVEAIMEYPVDEELFTFARELVTWLMV